MRIRTLVAERGRAVHTISDSETVAAAISRLAEKRVGALIVTLSGEPVGLFAERDVFRCYLRRQDRAFEEIPVREAMTNKLISAGPDDKVGQTIDMMVAADIRHLPVVRDHKIIAMLTLSDLMKYHVAELSEEIHHLHDYIRDSQDACHD